MYIIILKGERGTHYTVKKVFTTIEKAEKYAKNCTYIHHGLSEDMEKVISKNITKVEVV